MEIKENGGMDYPEYRIHGPLRVTDPAIHWGLDDGVINAVITAAVWSEERRPGIWQGMINALNRGAEGTKEGTVNAFLFRAMVDRLLEEFHHPETDQNSAG